MNANGVAKRYDALTAEERFRLIVAAGARGDKVEQDRLNAAGKHFTVSMQDLAPFAYAFSELAELTFIELLDGAAAYLESFYLADATAEADSGDESKDEPEAAEARDDETEDTGEGEGALTIADRCFDMALAEGYMLKARARGWELFCERMSVPPFSIVRTWPGFDRLKRALEMAEKAAYKPKGMLRWLNRRRPKGTPPATEGAIFTAETTADELAKAFRERVEWWGG